MNSLNFEIFPVHAFDSCYASRTKSQIGCFNVSQWPSEFSLNPRIWVIFRSLLSYSLIADFSRTCLLEYYSHNRISSLECSVAQDPLKSSEFRRIGFVYHTNVNNWIWTANFPDPIPSDLVERSIYFSTWASTLLTWCFKVNFD